MGRAEASSSITGRHRNITQLATNNEIGELVPRCFIRNIDGLSDAGENILDSRNEHNSW